MFSVVILTLNEEARLPRCLASVKECSDVVVLDSGSTDRTVEIAQASGARVFSNPFETFAQQRNYAHDQIKFRHSWLFHLDADEQFTPELHHECQNWNPAPSNDGTWVAPKMMWRKRWIPRCTDFPAWQARFVRPDRFRFIEVGHGQRESPNMEMSYLVNNYIHNLSADGVDGWLAKHRRYAKYETRAQFESSTIKFRNLVSPDRLIRRRTLKQVSYLIPFRASARFIYQYLLRQGFREGVAGFEYCRLLARYEGFAQAELRTLRRQSRAPLNQP